ncbi:hypothetical protein ABPG73_009230 [Tetrahymena malaccensis]
MINLIVTTIQNSKLEQDIIKRVIIPVNERHYTSTDKKAKNSKILRKLTLKVLLRAFSRKSIRFSVGKNRRSRQRRDGGLQIAG